jgi:hypothetical protein
MGRRRITPDEKNQISELFKLGKNTHEIAEALGWSHDTAARSVQRQITTMKKSGQLEGYVPVPKRKRKQKKDEEKPDEPKLLDEYTREGRFDLLSNTLRSTPRFRLAFQAFSTKEKALFMDEYFNVVKSTETLNEAEEQSLFAAILEYTLALRSLNLKRKEEDLFERTMDGEFDREDPQFRASVDGRFQREYESHMDRYSKIMASLKMSRDQRLKDVSGQRRTLTDIAQELSSRSAQADAAEEIERLDRLKEVELKAMLQKDFIFGEFSE